MQSSLFTAEVAEYRIRMTAVLTLYYANCSTEGKKANSIKLHAWYG